ncbi:MAG: secretin N-terminal domain-containing protein, partial [Bdellovibrionota bacterium]
LDRKLPPSVGGGKVHVIYLQFADAEKLSQTLNNLSQGAGAARSNSPIGLGTGFNPVQASLFEGNIKIAADVATNSLVITASPTDFSTIQRVVARLDIPRDEVYVEVVIMEMTIGRSSQLSVNVINPPSGIASLQSNDLLSFLTNQAAQTGTILGFAAGKPYSLDLGGGKTQTISSVTGLVKALQTNANANVLATPQIIALDNQEEIFESSENIPQLKQVATQGVITTSTENSKVTLSIKLKPQINKLSNFVKLDIDTKIGDFSSAVLPPEVEKFAKATIDRNAKTVVVVGDGDTVVIGGLTRDKVSDIINKVPILGDIPILGWLFKSKRSDVSKSNLMIFMTPHIVRQYEKVRAILDQKLKERDDFIEAYAGGNDPNRAKRDDMIRSLPDIKALSAKRPVAVATDDETPAAVPVDEAELKKANPGASAPPVLPQGVQQPD